MASRLLVTRLKAEFIGQNQCISIADPPNRVTAMTFKTSVLTLMPEAFPGVLGVSIIGRALEKGLWDLDVVDIRKFGVGKHKQVDDTPAGGGAGMVLRADVIADAIDSVEAEGRPLVYMSPRGRRVDQSLIRQWSNGNGLVVLCGRFEGLDQRVIDSRNIQEVSLGDFVLAGGEVAAQAMIEACVRLLPGVAGNETSLEHESFETGLLEHPHYTRPRDWENRPIPDVLLSGDHKKIEEWRLEQSLSLTKSRRPDLYASFKLNAADDARSKK
jgi:tRNA (guanine37-N1)-methyltransferase